MSRRVALLFLIALTRSLGAQTGQITGTVVDSRLILTAGHCLAELPAVSNLTVYYGNDLQGSMSVPATGYGAHPDFDPEGREDIHDYGYVELGVDFVPPDGLVPPIVDQDEWDEVMRKGTTVTLVGFGEDPDAESPLVSTGSVQATVNTPRSRSTSVTTSLLSVTVASGSRYRLAPLVELPCTIPGMAPRCSARTTST